jgi:hypothetical protein
MEVPNIVLAQAVELPDFSGLPLYAQGILYTVLALGLALSVIIPRFGFLHGRESGKTGPAGATVAAVVVDPTALNAHTAALNRVAEVAEKGLGELSNEIDKLREELHITREVNKARNNH